LKAIALPFDNRGLVLTATRLHPKAQGCRALAASLGMSRWMINPNGVASLGAWRLGATPLGLIRFADVFPG